MRPKISMWCDLNVDAVVVDLAGQLHHDEIFKFIVKLEEQCADSDLAKRLYRHFSKINAKLEAEEQLDYFPAFDVQLNEDTVNIRGPKNKSNV